MNKTIIMEAKKEFPELLENFTNHSSENGSYGLASYILKDDTKTVEFTQIVSGGKFDALTDDKILYNLKKMIQSNLKSYDDLNRIEILRRRRRITHLVAGEITSTESVNSSRYEELKKFYSITKTEEERTAKAEEREKAKLLKKK